MARRKVPAEIRFWSMVLMRDDESCWEWLAATTSKGYGIFNAVKGAPTTAHRFAYEQANGPIPDGLQIDHLCRNRSCVNPAHLEPVAARENIRRGMSVSAVTMRTNTCQRGHALTDENTMYYKDGHRRCRACEHIRAKKYRDRQMATRR